ncbi:MAG TPA: aldehyde ferredoxin oxidoreductase C-terminal domain-containing protein, partial [Myxococcota bacterium]|nr:aldehyde ferredoxin oxidoreductase C-terminal domain-containing protein [Myxococcota bacterium]
LGIRAIVVTGQPSDAERRYGLRVDENGAEVVAADDYKNMMNYAACAKLLEGESKRASAISIGPAGERRLRGASVACTDQDAERRPARHAARGGLGAVMGSKGLKWVLVDPGKARTRQPASGKDFNALTKRYTKAYLDGPQMFKHGTSSVVPVANMLHTFVYKNRTVGQSPDVQTLDGARIVENFDKRGGGMHNCMTGCIVKCSNVVHDADGNYRTSALEFETITLLGSNCAIKTVDEVAILDRLCDELGLDTIETGAALGVLMDSGGMDWGDSEAAARLLESIQQGDETGCMIGDGVVETGRRRKHKRVPHARGQAIPAWDPRPLKATGVTYAAGPMGADHTAGLIVNPGLAPDQFAQASQEAQLVNMVCDSSGFCQFLQPSLDDIREYYGLLYGIEISREEIADQGWECLQDEWAFNKAAGWRDEDNGVSECLVEEGIGPDNVMKFDVPLDIINQSKVRFPAREELFTMKASG